MSQKAKDTVDKMIDAELHSLPKQATQQIATQGGKYLANQAIDLGAETLAGLNNLGPKAINGAMAVAEGATKVVRFAPAIAAPAGMYMDIRSGMSPGMAITAGTASATAAIVAGSLATGPVGLTMLAGAGAGIAGYYAGKAVYKALPDSWQRGIDTALSATGRTIANAASGAWNGVRKLFGG